MDDEAHDGAGVKGMSRMTITVGEAAEMLGISRTSAYLCARRQEIPTVRLGRRVLVPVARFMAMLEADPAPHESDDARQGRVVSLRDPRVVQVPRPHVALNRNIWLTGPMATKIRLDASPNVAGDLADDVRSASNAEQAATIAVEGREFQLPPDLVALLLDLLDDVAEGRDVTVAPAGLPVGTELASELLGVSRPWLTTLLDRGDIPSTRVGSKRRVRLGDLLAYRRADDARRRQALTWEFLGG
jgi:excisionase family DNA binding protein